MNLNKMQLIGRLAVDPEMRFTASGKAVTTFRVAVGNKSGSGDNRREETDYFTVVVWDKQAENAGQYLIKGQEVYVEGRLQNRSWDGPDGQKRYATEIVARDVQFGAKPRGQGDGDVDSIGFGWGGGDFNPDDLPFE